LKACLDERDVGMLSFIGSCTKRGKKGDFGMPAILATLQRKTWQKYSIAMAPCVDILPFSRSKSGVYRYWTKNSRDGAMSNLPRDGHGVNLLRVKDDPLVYPALVYPAFK
jgi:hypothetical protein